MIKEFRKEEIISEKDRRSMRIKVLLVNPPLSSIFGGFPPLGLMYIASVLEKNGISVEIFDRQKLNYEQYISVFLDYIRKTTPDIIGFTCYIGDVDDVRELCLKIKQIRKDVIIVVGGFHPSMFPEQFFGYSDYVVIGEGEMTMLELIKTIESKREVTKVKGIAILGKKIIYTESRELADINMLPGPAYHLVDMKYYTNISDGRLRGVLLNCGFIFSSRGCPFKCTFCPMTRFLGLKQRYMNPVKVVDEIEFLVKNYNINGLQFLDETLTLNRKHIVEICDEILKRKINIMWGSYTRANLVNSELLKKLSESGCIQIDFGVESGSQRVLDMLKKGVTIEQIKHTFKLCREYNIRTFANYLTNIPGETVEEREKTIEFANSLNADRFTYNIFLPYPNTKINEENGIIISEKDYKYFFMFKRNSNLKFFSENYNFTPDKKDLDELFNDATKRIRHASPYPILLNQKYLCSILRSKRKIEYILWMQNKLIYLIKKYNSLLVNKLYNMIKS